METDIILVFVVGYLAITLEHNLKIDKLIPALVMMAISWALIALGIDTFPQWFDRPLASWPPHRAGPAPSSANRIRAQLSQTSQTS